MTSKPPLPQTETLIAQPSTNNRRSSTGNRTTKPSLTKIQARRLTKLSNHVMVGIWAVAAALITATQTDFARSWERQAQTLFFELRGPIAPPQNIVILALDEDTQVQGTQVYSSDPQRYAYLEPLQTSPPKRAAYAVAIDRLTSAGARAVSLDIVLDALSSHGPEDDQRLLTTLTKHADRVVLAAQYDDANNQTTREGNRTQLLTPNPIFQLPSLRVGFINFLIEPNGKLHQLGSQYPQQVARTYSPDLAQLFLQQSALTPSFAEASLQAAQQQHFSPKGSTISFYGPRGTFQHVPFWQVLDPESWSYHVKNGTFKNKIVLIGPTAEIYQDSHSAPFSGTLLHPNRMSGVEVHANSIATLLQNRAIANALPNPAGQGAVVLILVAAAAYVQTRSKRLLHRLALVGATVLVWGGVSYAVFVYAGLILPVALPITAMALSGVSYLVMGLLNEDRQKLNFKQILKSFASAPIVQDIIRTSEQEDLQDLLLEKRNEEIVGTKLADRYEITKVLGAGGFGETYIAKDIRLPGAPLCVVKQLRPVTNNPKHFQLAQRLFELEAKILQQLGRHDQIPQLLAYFEFEEQQEFYLVQEFIDGSPLSDELRLTGNARPERWVVDLLQNLLFILEFVHSQNVIHRDIKPSNIIRRKSDGKPVLIDFGAVKQKLIEEGEQSTLTVAIGTKDYMPDEQCAGRPEFNSDIYAVGIIGIQSLTGFSPKKDTNGEVDWRRWAPHVSHALATVLSKMVRRDFRERYQSATDVLQDLKALAVTSPLPAVIDLSSGPLSALGSDANEESLAFGSDATKVWSQNVEESSLLPPTDRN
ncbi:CHASE2 domain-containing protein [Leptolyngbya sp. FACHB-36]|uniref:serine/threonine-protein kinase n=1 Tax=Leptolyngbya sp. FACHB-36 TaxID=2692808 RepID=UPI001680BDCC|nr:serine/threonine-protein kinase [Leptolyngbya sp. FACHB-36]MBD2019835.1 CHASE2 domain-containing protein [Leptolyngbya sp. FACHB-36]